jgi:hypothetical protein
MRTLGIGPSYRKHGHHVRYLTGLMQVMPGTYSHLRKHYGFGPDSYDPHDNILAGTAYLRQMYDRYGYPSLFAAYNAGPKRFEAFISGSKSLPTATLNYVERILPGVGKTFDRARVAGPIASEKLHQRTAKGAIHDAHDSLFFVRSELGIHAKIDSGDPNLSSNSSSIFVNSSVRTQAPLSDARGARCARLYRFGSVQPCPSYPSVSGLVGECAEPKKAGPR